MSSPSWGGSMVVGSADSWHPQKLPLSAQECGWKRSRCPHPLWGQRRKDDAPLKLSLTSLRRLVCFPARPLSVLVNLDGRGVDSPSFERERDRKRRKARETSASSRPSSAARRAALTSSIPDTMLR